MNQESSQTEKKTISYYELILHEVKEWSLNVSIQGIPSFSRANNIFLRVFWALALLAATGYSSYLIALSIQSYLEYPIVTNIYQVSEVPTKFPTVMICNKSPFNAPFGVSFARSVLDANNINYLNMGLGSIYGNLFANFVVGTNALGTTDLTDKQKQNLTLSLENMLIGCVFNQINCNASDWSWSFNVFYGNCYSFNSGKDANSRSIDDKKATRSGSLNGLYVLLYMGESKDLYSLSADAGVHLFVNNKSVYNAYTKGYSLSTGKKYQVYVDRVFYENLPDPYSSCTDDETLQKSDLPIVKQILAAGYTYRFDDCLQVCFSKNFLQKNCSCQDISAVVYDKTNGIEPCMNITQLTCYFYQYQTFVNSDTHALCGKDCPLECSHIEYDLSFSDSDFPTEAYYEFLLNQTDFMSKFDYDVNSVPMEKVKKTMLMANINYQDLRYTLVVADPKIQIIDLIGSVGGQLGLFIGASMMTLVEVFDLFVSVTFIFMREKYKQFMICKAKKSCRKTKPLASTLT